jgi:hypothetical protein
MLGWRTGATTPNRDTNSQRSAIRGMHVGSCLDLRIRTRNAAVKLSEAGILRDWLKRDTNTLVCRLLGTGQMPTNRLPPFIREQDGVGLGFQIKSRSQVPWRLEVPGWLQDNGPLNDLEPRSRVAISRPSGLYHRACSHHSWACTPTSGTDRGPFCLNGSTQSTTLWASSHRGFQN